MTYLARLTFASDRAWNEMMNGSERDACSIKGQEGRNYIAWCKAAAAERAYRERHDLLEEAA